MTAQAPVLREHGNSYNIFILVLTLFSLAIMAALLLPLDDDTRQLLTLYDNVICVIFLGDFAMNLAGSRPRRAYLIGQRGWLDLLGSIPSVGVFQLGALFRLARLSRLARIGKLLGGKNRKDARRGRAPQPRPVRDVHHGPGRGDGAVGRERPRPPVRERGRRTPTSRPAAMRSGGAS